MGGLSKYMSLLKIDIFDPPFPMSLFVIFCHDPPPPILHPEEWQTLVTLCAKNLNTFYFLYLLRLPKFLAYLNVTLKRAL